MNSLTRVGSCINCSIWNRLKHEITRFDVVLLSSPDTSQLKSPVTIVSFHSHDTLSIISPIAYTSVCVHLISDDSIANITSLVDSFNRVMNL